MCFSDKIGELKKTERFKKVLGEPLETAKPLEDFGVRLPNVFTCICMGVFVCIIVLFMGVLIGIGVLVYRIEYFL